MEVKVKKKKSRGYRGPLREWEMLLLNPERFTPEQWIRNLLAENYYRCRHSILLKYKDQLYHPDLQYIRAYRDEVGELAIKSRPMNQELYDKMKKESSIVCSRCTEPGKKRKIVATKKIYTICDKHYAIMQEDYARPRDSEGKIERKPKPTKQDIRRKRTLGR